ncbi:MAG: hypothetical protein G01um101466_618, partial [Parcubacteria group bacterium Gr01-1014_66]
MNVRLLDAVLEEFIQSLESGTIAKVLRTIDLLEIFGHRLGMPHSKSVGGGLLELRIRGVQDVRIFYAFKSGEALLLHGYIKKSR